MGSGEDCVIANENSGNYQLASPVHADRRKYGLAALFMTVALFTAMLFAQGTAHVTGIEPAAGKVNESATVKGENLGKGSVAAVFLSDDKADFKAALTEQAGDKINIKIP